jgi:hypothetical protein
VEAFGAAEAPEDLFLAEATGGRAVDTDAPLSSLASSSVEDAVDVIWASAAQDVKEADEAESLAALAYQASAAMPELASDTAISQAADDQEWLNALAARLVEAEPRSTVEVEAFGGSAVWDRLSEALIRVRAAAARLTGRTGLAIPAAASDRVDSRPGRFGVQ